MRVAGNLLSGQLFEHRAHLRFGIARGLGERDLIVLDHVAGQERAVVGHDLGGGKRLDLAKQIR